MAQTMPQIMAQPKANPKETTHRRRPILIPNHQDKIHPIPRAPDLQYFHQSLPGYTPTPLVSLDALAKELNIKAVLVKDESARLGLPSFKMVGASWGVFRAVAAKTGISHQASMDEVSSAACRQGVRLFTATDGNHGRAIARMGKRLCLPVTVYVPYTVPQHTRDLITGEGADVVVLMTHYDTAVKEATRAANDTLGGILVQDTAFEGYEEIPAWIIEGYSTIFNEIDDQTAALGLTPSSMILPVGVGSIAEAGIRSAKAGERATQVVAVEPETAACLYESLLAGQSIPIQTSHTIMNGMDCGTLSTSSWPILRDNVDVCLTISDYESHCSVEYLAMNGLSIGPCGASTLAALRRLHLANLLDKDAVVVLLGTEGTRPYEIPPQVSSYEGRAELQAFRSMSHL